MKKQKKSSRSWTIIKLTNFKLLEVVETNDIGQIKRANNSLNELVKC